MRILMVTIIYTTENERCVERHKCSSKEEAEYLVNLTRQLAPLELAYQAKWIDA